MNGYLIVLGFLTMLLAFLWVMARKHRAFDRQLLTLQEELEERVEERTQELRRREKRLLDIVGSLGEGIYVFDRSGQATFLNQEAERLLGWTMAELNERSPHDLVHNIRADGTPLPIDQCNMLNVVRTGEQYISRDEVFVRKDGKVFPISVIASPIFDNGEACGAVVAFRDISRIKMAEEALQASEERYRTLFEGAPDAIFIADPETGIILDVNTAACRLLAKPRGKLIGCHQSLLHPPKQEEFVKTTFRHHVQAAPHGLVDIPQELTVQRSDGAEVPVEIMVAAIELRGRPAILGVFRDISERKVIEGRIARQTTVKTSMTTLARGLLTAASLAEATKLTLDQAIVLTDSRYGYVGYIEPVSGHLLCPARTDDIWAGQPMPGAGDIGIEFKGPWGWVLVNRQPLLSNDLAHDERTVEIPTGTLSFKNFLSAPALDGETLVGQIALADRAEGYSDEDLETVVRLASLLALGIKRLRAEEENRRLSSGLEEKVRIRTMEVAAKGTELEESQRALMNIVEDLNEKTAELEEANTKLQGLDHLKSLFIASMSHELRTPLNSIIGFSSIVLNEWFGPLNEEQKAKLAIVLRTGKHLLTLINDVIDVSKIEAGKMETYPVEFDLQELVDEALELARKEIDEKGLGLEVETIPVRLRTDRRRLFQCLVNLLGNATKFTEQGRIRLETSLVPPPIPGLPPTAVRISVSDTGIGIPAEEQPKLFSAFTRIASPLLSTVKGTGLGLYLVKKITTEILQGEVGMESTYGQGSTFYLEIPLNASEQANVPPEVAAGKERDDEDRSGN